MHVYLQKRKNNRFKLIKTSQTRHVVHQTRYAKGLTRHATGQTQHAKQRIHSTS